MGGHLPLRPSNQNVGGKCPPVPPIIAGPVTRNKTKYRPGGTRRYAPADGSSIQKSRRIYVRPLTGPQSAHLWWPAVAKLQAASVPIV